jgi:hypothetical protein
VCNRCRPGDPVVGTIQNVDARLVFDDATRDITAVPALGLVLPRVTSVRKLWDICGSGISGPTGYLLVFSFAIAALDTEDVSDLRR